MKNVIDTDLTGKVAVVTGASGTLCSIFAMALARAGAKVALLGRNLAKLNEVADKIAAEGGIAKGYACNVLSKDNCSLREGAKAAAPQRHKKPPRT